MGTAGSPPRTVQSYHQSYEGRPVTPGGLGGGACLPGAAEVQTLRFEPFPNKSMGLESFTYLWLKFAAKSIGKTYHTWRLHMGFHTT